MAEKPKNRGTGKTERNKVFADVYAGNSAEAAKIAGLSPGYARQLVMDTNATSITPAALAVQERIKERELTEVRPEVATRIERQLLWSKWMKGEETPTTEQLKASELLGKSELDFGDRHVIAVPQSIADISAIMGIGGSEPPALNPVKENTDAV